jgi:hypothetical protein
VRRANECDWSHRCQLRFSRRSCSRHGRHVNPSQAHLNTSPKPHAKLLVPTSATSLELHIPSLYCTRRLCAGKGATRISVWSHGENNSETVCADGMRLHNHLGAVRGGPPLSSPLGCQSKLFPGRNGLTAALNTQLDSLPRRHEQVNCLGMRQVFRRVVSDCDETVPSLQAAEVRRTPVGNGRHEEAKAILAPATEREAESPTTPVSVQLETELDWAPGSV